MRIRILPRSPWTLWRHMLREQSRLVLITACVFVCVIAFSAAIKPLADGKLGPLDAIRFMFYAMPPMLQYALPFAAGFGACLAYHRMATDNEFAAAHAGGISHRALLAPSAFIGLVLAGFLTLLSMQVIPRFLRAMEELVTQDATRLIVNSIERQQAFQLGSLVLYADSVESRGPNPASGAYEVLLLLGVVLIQTDDRGNIVSDGAATDANVWLFHGGRGREPGKTGGATIARIVMRGVKGNFADEGVNTTHDVLIRTVEVPNAFNDDPKFLPMNELRDLRANPERMNWIDRPRRDLAAALTERIVTASISELLQDEGRLTLKSRTGEPLTVRASSMAWDDAAKEWVLQGARGGTGGAGGTGGGGVSVLSGRTGGRQTRQIASRAALRTSLSPDDEQPVSITLRLTGVQTVLETADGDATPAGQRAELQLTDLFLLENPAPDLIEQPSDQLLETADLRLLSHVGDTDLGGRAAHLRSRIADLMREIMSKQNEQAAMAAACLVMVLTGAVMAMRLRDGTPLTVYLWAFFPALAALITISAGQQMTHQRGLVGLSILWGGVGLLLAYTILQFRRLARH